MPLRAMQQTFIFVGNSKDLDQVNMLEDKANDSQKTLLMTLFWEFYGM